VLQLLDEDEAPAEARGPLCTCGLFLFEEGLTAEKERQSFGLRPVVHSALDCRKCNQASTRVVSGMLISDLLNFGQGQHSSLEPP
jgi:hypothetical protein